MKTNSDFRSRIGLLLGWTAKWLDRLPDSIWPHLTGDVVPEPESLEHLQSIDQDLLDAAETALERRTTEGTERARNVDSRLIPLLALSSTISTALAISIPFALSGNFSGIRRIDLLLVLVGVTYVAMQLLVCLNAVINGMTRRAYLSVAEHDLEPRVNESALAYRLRMLHIRTDCLWQNEWVTGRKVEQLAIAHVALQNALRGVAVLVVAAILIAAYRGSDHSNGESASIQEPKIFSPSPMPTTLAPTTRTPSPLPTLTAVPTAPTLLPTSAPESSTPPVIPLP